MAKMLWCGLLLLSLNVFWSEAHASTPSMYKTVSIKMGFYRMDQGDEGWQVSSGEAISAGVGIEVLPILALEINGNAWYPRENEQYDFHFAGMSIGTNVLLQLPGEGPYAKFGRHCWSANVFDVVDIYNGSGCSNTLGGGLLLKNNQHTFFLEANRIRFKRVDSWFLSAGVRF